MTFTELVAEVVARTARADKNTEAGVAVNLALKELTQIHFFRDLQSNESLSYTADAEYVALPSRTRAILEARLINGTQSYPIILKAKKWVLDRWSKVSELNASYPIYAYIEDEKLYICPEASADYTIEVTALIYAADISGSTENPIANSDEAIVAWASMYIFGMIQNTEMSVFWEKRYNKAVTRLIHADRSHNLNDVAQEFRVFSPALQRASARISPHLDPFDMGRDY